MARSFQEMNDTKKPPAALKKYQMSNDVPVPKAPVDKRKISPASAARIRAKASRLLES